MLGCITRSSNSEMKRKVPKNPDICQDFSLKLNVGGKLFIRSERRDVYGDFTKLVLDRRHYGRIYHNH